MARVSIFLITVALVAGMIGCGSPPIEIRDWYDLDAIRDNLGGSYLLMNDLDSTTAGYEELASEAANQGKGWEPIGTEVESFRGNFDGQGYEIRDLFINRPDEGTVGLFDIVYEEGRIENIGVVNATVTGFYIVGGLVAVNEGTVSDSYSTGSVTGNSSVGGLVGENVYGTVSNSYATGSVTGGFVVGGLVGENVYGTVSNSYATGDVTGVVMEKEPYSGIVVGGLVGSQTGGTVSNSYAAGSVSGYEVVGGLVAFNEGGKGGTVSDSYSTGSVTGNSSVGGLVGVNGGAVGNSYSTGNVTGDSGVGGLVGENYGTVNNSYSSGNMTGYEFVGGLVGRNVGTVDSSYSTGNVTGDSGVGGLVAVNEGIVSNSYSTGSVSGNDDVGGLVGRNYEGTVRNSVWDTETSGQANSAGGTGKTTAEMQDIATFSGMGWNIIAVANPGTRNPSYIWNIVDNETYPFLSWQS